MKYFKYDSKDVKKDTVNIVVNGRTIPLLILSPLEPKENAPGVLWIHGGGYVAGFKEMVYMGRGIDLVKKFGAVVISPGYNLAITHPYPTALYECYEALLYLKNHTKELGVNPNQIIVGGESAGGGLTAAVSMLARDKGEVKIAFQLPLYPMIDNEDTESSKDNHNKIWNTRRNHIGWKLYLRDIANKEEISPYAAPSRQTDYSNLPPTYTFVCTDEPFYSETVQFIDDLQKAGVEAKCDVYEGLYHAFDVVEPDHPKSVEAIENFDKFFDYAKNHYFAENIVQ